jgi:hypothetical protein
MTVISAPEHRIEDTTSAPARIFNDILRKEIRFINKTLAKAASAI